jgi:hypothetical protein
VAWGNSIIHRPASDWRLQSSVIKVNDRAVLIDQTGATPMVSTAAGLLVPASSVKPRAKRTKKTVTK